MTDYLQTGDDFVRKVCAALMHEHWIAGRFHKLISEWDGVEPVFAGFPGFERDFEGFDADEQNEVIEELNRSVSALKAVYLTFGGDVFESYRLDEHVYSFMTPDDAVAACRTYMRRNPLKPAKRFDLFYGINRVDAYVPDSMIVVKHDGGKLALPMTEAEEVWLRVAGAQVAEEIPVAELVNGVFHDLAAARRDVLAARVMCKHRYRNWDSLDAATQRKLILEWAVVCREWRK
jgi:hypothetical protein